jgi:catechol 2,3-dioxygenase-like lactoylglutathione lyase family enzyme
MQPLVPELYVSDIATSLGFYVDILGFSICYQRLEQQFAYLALGDAELMIEQPNSRQWLLAALEHPYGRGINLQISVSDVSILHAKLASHKIAPLVALETRRYRRANDSIEVSQFVVADPDGYLLRFSETIKIVAS